MSNKPSKIAVNSFIPVTFRGEIKKAKVRKIGEPFRNDRGGFAWSMLTLDVEGECAYVAAREDEIAQEFSA